MPPKLSKRPRPDDAMSVDDSEDESLSARTCSGPVASKDHYTAFQPFKSCHHLQSDGSVLRDKTWFSMVRVLKGPSHGYGPRPLASWMVHAMLDVAHPDPEAPGTNGCWTCAVGNESWEERAPQVVLELLRFVILDEDPRLTGTVWLIMKRRAGSWTAASELIRSNGIFARLLFKNKEEQLIKTIAFLALVSRRPRLLNAVLDSYKCHVYDVKATNRVGEKVAQNLVCVAMAIVDCVFSPDHSVSYEESYKAFVERNIKATPATDTALCLASWVEAIEKIMRLCGTDTPSQVWARVPNGDMHSMCLLEASVRVAEHCPDFLDHMLAARHWPAFTIEIALRMSIAPHGVRGPNLARIISNLYVALLHEWKSNTTKRERLIVLESDELAMVWRNLVVTASGYNSVETGSGGNAAVPMSPFLLKMSEHKIPVSEAPDHACMRHPEEWEGIFDAIISCHDPTSELAQKWQYDGWDPSYWNTKSPLFESLVRQALRKLVDEPNKTKLLSYFINVLEKGRKKKDPPPSWLSIAGLFNAIALHHPVALGLVIEYASIDQAGEKHTYTDENGVHHFAPRKEHHEALKSTLFLCITQKRRQAVRTIIQALNGHLDYTIKYTEDEEEVTTAFLPFYVKNMGDGATAEDRNKHGEDYGEFVNTRVENDFKAVLKAMNWSDDALKEALRFASFYQRPICAAQLMATPYCQSPDDDPYLMAISAWMHQPSNPGAKLAEREFLKTRDGSAAQE